MFDRILDLLFGHLDQRAVLVLRWQRLRPVPRDPGVQLQRMTGGVRGGCNWLPEAGQQSQGRDAGRERQWPEVRHARELISQAEDAGEQDGRKCGKDETENGKGL